MRNLTPNVRFSSGLNHVSAATDRTGVTLDMNGFNGVVILVRCGAIATGAVVAYKVQHGSLADMSDATDIPSLSLTLGDSDDNAMIMFELGAPTKRYVRIFVDKDGVNLAAEMVTYMQYGPARKSANLNTLAGNFVRLVSSPA